MRPVIMIYVLAFVFSATAIAVLRPIATRIGLVDLPGGRKQHDWPTPLTGGLGLVLPCVTGVFLVTGVHPVPLAYLAASLLLLVCGVTDDLHELRVLWRLSAQIAAATIIATVGGVVVTDLGNVLGTGTVQLGWLSVPFTVFAIVGMINAFNLLDGVDGLSGTIALAVLASLALAAVVLGAEPLLLLFGVVMAAVAGFLVWNFRIGRSEAAVFLGDSGSTWLGFTLACLTILLVQAPPEVVAAQIQPVLALWILAVPVCDTLSLMLKRLRDGRSIFEADHEHIHHLLLRMGCTVNQTVAIVGAATFATGVAGIALGYIGVPAYFSLALFVASFAAFHVWSRRTARRVPPLIYRQRRTRVGY